jgi:hypothetical protein
MKKLLIASAAGVALLGSVAAANAQYYSDDGYYGGPYRERSVGLQIGPVGIGVYSEPSYYEPAPSWRSRAFRGDHTHSTYNTQAFRSQEWLPQSPPSGGY